MAAGRLMSISGAIGARAMLVHHIASCDMVREGLSMFGDRSESRIINSYGNGGILRWNRAR
jgi:hypothetical protein